MNGVIKIFYWTIVLVVVSSIKLAHSQNIFYINSLTGNDSNSGTISQPFKTISKGVSALGSNIGTLYLRGGTYSTSSKINLTMNGQPNQFIKIWAYANEKVIVDFTGSTSDGFSISGSYHHLKNLDIRKAGHNGINISGNNNIIENCITRNCSNTGLHLTGSSAPGPSNNLILNCDSFYNFDSPTGGNADGFSTKWTVGNGNRFRGCRAWNNSDDGWDLWMCTGSIEIDSCYAFRNGVDIWNTGQVDGNGNGFKLGGNNIATPHIVKNCIAFDNAGNGGKGFDENNNLAGQTLYNCTSFRNKSNNYALYNNPLTSGIHTVKNCISYLPGKADVIINAVQDKNSWQGFNISSIDFKSLDTTGCVAARNPDGTLPYNNFLRLKAGSSLIDAGANVGPSYLGVAPDIGAFEFSITDNIILEESSRLNVICYPNPFSDETIISIHVEETKKDMIVTIYDRFGSLVYTFTFNSSFDKTFQIKLDTQQWHAGVYLYNIIAGNRRYQGKMIKLQ